MGLHWAAAILVDALRAASDPSGGVNIDVAKRYLHELKNYSGLSGTISVDADGAVRTIRESIYTFTGGKLERKQNHRIVPLREKRAGQLKTLLRSGASQARP